MGNTSSGKGNVSGTLIGYPSSFPLLHSTTATNELSLLLLLLLLLRLLSLLLPCRCVVATATAVVAAAIAVLPDTFMTPYRTALSQAHFTVETSASLYKIMYIKISFSFYMSIRIRPTSASDGV